MSYSSQRFASSSFVQWVKIEDNFSSNLKAFDLLHPKREKEEEWQYMITGTDFVKDLLGTLEIMEPVAQLMARSQTLDVPIWKLKLWWPKIKKNLEEAARGDPEGFPKLEKVRNNFKPGGKFKHVTLLQGWLVIKDRGKDAGADRYTWKMRESSEIKADREEFANSLMKHCKGGLTLL